FARPGVFPYHEIDAARINVLARHRRGAGPAAHRVLRAPVAISDTLIAPGPQVQVDARGDGLIVWEIGRSAGQPMAIEIARARAGQSFSSRVLATGDPSQGPGAAIGANGAAILT